MHKKLLAIAALTGGLALAAPAWADTLDIDLTGWQTAGRWDHALNSDAFVDIGPGSALTSAEWIDLEINSQGVSWLSDFIISLNDSAITQWWDSTVSDTDGGGTYTGSGSFPGPNFDGGPFSVLDDGLVYIQVYESFDDNGEGLDTIVTTGTLRLHFTPIPEPAALAGLGAAGLLLLRRRSA